ncbi:DUF1330 domain-containing protein [Paraburkholderia diazotrophica]|uniref:DUF1330 domain-containing protein n=1 Tax=Paraburkholderia diazotrophica TaxID=667676 RepID=UPI003D162CA3
MLIPLVNGVEIGMSTFAVAHLHEVKMGVEIVEYLKRIDATLAPFCGHFVLHGGRYERLEGDWRGDLIAIEFPNRDLARAWYRSDAYQAILPLRTGNSIGDVILIDAVPASHIATDVLCG